MAVTGRHLRALDGLRAVAVAGVLAYHLDLGWASGGYLGVDLFFVLSGFLITALLLEEWARRGTVALGAFWGRRARRLLPALFLLLVLLGAFVVAMGRWGPPGWAAQVDLSALRGDAIATLLYVANWHAIYAHQSYFAQFSGPSPLQHTWSLAIEEQFYLVWPLVLVGLLTLWRRRKGAVGGAGVAGGPTGTGWRHIGVALCVVAGLGSAALMGVLAASGGDPTRAYVGTDTRMFDLLAGAVVAMVAAARPQPGPGARRLLHAAGPVAVAGLAVAWVCGGTPTGEPRHWMFDGGFLACAALAAVVVADVRLLDPGPLARALSWRPLRAVGVISYGIYLYHWPVFVFLDARTGLSPVPLDLARVGLTLAIATASYLALERPLRRMRFASWPRTALGPAAALGTVAVVVLATIPAVAVGDPSAAQAALAARESVGARGRAVPGAGGIAGEAPLRLPAFGPADPLRVTVLGDSVAKAAEPALAAALGATGDVVVDNATIDGFGLSTDPIWRSSLPQIVASEHAQVVLATWSWDDDCSASSPTALAHHADEICALEHPAAYAAMLHRAVSLMLGAGADAVVFLQFPTTGPVSGVSAGAERADDAERSAGEHAWDRIARSTASAFAGRALYLPVAGSLLLHGSFTSWLPPVDDPHAPADQWLRVRSEDNVHLCPAGAARYAAAVLADLSAALSLEPAPPGWASGRWTHGPVYNDPPGSCPADHPPG